MSAPTPSLEPLDRRSTADVIAETIRGHIMDGSFEPGRQLTEVELAGQLEVSRGPVREAFQRLVQEGLLAAVPHRGVFVATIEADEVADVYLARSVVEREAARLVARRRDPQALATLAGLVADMAASSAADDWAAVSEVDLAFHEALVEVSGSPRLARMYRTLLAETRLCLRGLRRVHPDSAEVVDEHRGLVDALTDGDEDRAVACVTRHLTRAVADADGH
ncbi:MAG TPA: GntR family transcriptional regulator [Acidimicrobiales bacterium]|nr:GntR family transcriptional regulator [Acidimicrobiales bacterium]